MKLIETLVTAVLKDQEEEGATGDGTHPRLFPALQCATVLSSSISQCCPNAWSKVTLYLLFDQFFAQSNGDFEKTLHVTSLVTKESPLGPSTNVRPLYIATV